MALPLLGRVALAAAWCFPGAAGLRHPASREAPLESESGEAEPNFCVQGRIVPRFFLFGLPRLDLFFEEAASVYRRRTNSTERILATDTSKEPWIFDGGFGGSMEAWLEHYPSCGSGGRFVSMDASPSSFTNDFTPFLISSLYVNFELEHQVKFLIFLRNPLLRSQEHYHNYKAQGVLDGAVLGCAPFEYPPTFQVAVQNLIQHQAVCNCKCDSMMTDSLYVDYLKRYFQVFDSSQFHILPYANQVSGEVVQYVWDTLGIRQDLSHRLVLTRDRYMIRPEQPQLHEELDTQALLAFKEYMSVRVAPAVVANILAKSNAHLYSFHGTRRSASKIAFWLRLRWGNATF